MAWQLLTLVTQRLHGRVPADCPLLPPWEELTENLGGLVAAVRIPPAVRLHKCGASAPTRAGSRSEKHVLGLQLFQTCLKIVIFFRYLVTPTITYLPTCLATSLPSLLAAIHVDTHARVSVRTYVYSSILYTRIHCSSCTTQPTSTPDLQLRSDWV